MISQELESTSPHTVARRIIIVLVLLGSICRIAQYLAQRSYWHDEALLVQNITDKSFPALLGPLNFSQAAPPLFLWIEKYMALSAGTSEFSLRLLPLLAGLASLCLFALLAWRLFPAVAPWVVTFFALSDKFIAHSAEVKQYSTDVFTAVLLLFLALGIKRKLSSAAKLIILSSTAIIAVWFSHPSIIIFAALSLMLLPSLFQKGPRYIALYLACNLLVAVSFLLLYKFSIHPQHDPYLLEFWKEEFADWNRWYFFPIWLIKQTYRLADHPVRSLGALFMIMGIAGGITLYKTRQYALLTATLGPIALTALAACAHQYPYTGDRVTMFLFPGLFLLSAASLEYLSQAYRSAAVFPRYAWLALPLPIVAICSFEATQHLISPRTISHIRPVAQYLQQHRTPDQAIYLIGEGKSPAQPDLSSGLCRELLCYWRPVPPFYITMPPASQIPEKQFWVVFAFQQRHSLKYMSPFLDQLSKTNKELTRLILPQGGAAVLYEKQ